MSRAEKVIVLVARLGLAGLFVFAAIAKLRDPTGFAREIANYQLFPGLAPHLAATLPSMELVAALAALAPHRELRRAGALAIASLLAVFVVALVSVIVRGVNIECGCFGAGSGEVGQSSVARNLGLIAVALYLLRRDAPSSSSDGGSAGAGAGGGVSPGEDRLGRPG